MARGRKDYTVGYGKPPEYTRFQKGQSGNPKGRPPKKAESWTEMYERVLNEPVVTQLNGKRCTMTKAEVALRVNLNQAVQGELKAFMAVLGPALKAHLLASVAPVPQEPQKPQRSGVLMVPSPVDPESWAKACEEQQAQYRTDSGPKLWDKNEEDKKK